MASSSEDFPEPVGPAMANSSTPSKSIDCSSRNAVKPLRRRRSGRTLCALLLEREDLVEGGEELGIGRGAMRLFKVGDELVAGLEARDRHLWRWLVTALVLELHLDGSGQELA